MNFEVMPKNVVRDAHLKNSEVSQTPSNYSVLKMSEKVAAGRSWEIILSSSVKWSSWLVSFFWAALWNTESSNLKVMWTIRQRVFRKICCVHLQKHGQEKMKNAFGGQSVHLCRLQLSAEGEIGTLRLLGRILAQQWGLISCTEV